MPAADDRNRGARISATLSNIRQDAATAEVCRALSDRGVGSIILKGPALADLYPENSARTYADGDIWVSPADLEAARRALTDLGFMPHSDGRGLPDWWQEHAESWVRAVDGGAIDLHQKLQGVQVDAAASWALLWPQSVPMTIAGGEVRRLSDAGRVLYVTLHATHDGKQGERAIAHLDAALVSVDHQTWRAAADLATQLDALDAFGAGLRLTPAGAHLAQHLGIASNRSVNAALHATSPPPVALGFDQLATARGLMRIRILVRKLVPPPGFIRHWWPRANQSRRMLAVGYMYRPIWLLRHAPAGYRAWRAARRAVKSSS